MVDNVPIVPVEPMKSKARRGDWAELMAVTWLMESGFDVYRNVSRVGPVDVVGIRDGISYFFDVKYTHIRFNKEGKAHVVRCAKKSKNQENINVTFVYVTKEGVCGFSAGEVMRKYNAIAGNG